MRKLLALLVILTGITSCEKDSLLPSKVTAFINGDTWKSITQVATVVSDHVTITATDSQGRIITLGINGSIKGTYELSLAKQQCALAYKATPTGTAEDVYAGITGSITLTSVSSTSISGTFDFVCAKSLTPNETISITNGQFTNLRLLNY